MTAMSRTIRPSGAWITVNRSCNLRCPWCYAKGTGYEPQEIMSFELAKCLASSLKSIDVSQVQLIGGEPTLWPQLLKFNRLAIELGVNTNIITNAMRFGDDDFWEKYIEAPNSTAGISIKASRPEEMMTMTGVNKFKQITLGIRRAIEFFQCGVSVTYNTFYTDKLNDLAMYAMDLGARSLKIDFCSTVFESGSANNQFMVPPTEIVKNIIRDHDRLVEITEGRFVLEMNMPLCLWPPGFIQHLIDNDQILSVCHLFNREGLIFDTDGNLIVCNGLFEYPIGKYGTDFDSSESLLDYINQTEISSFYDKIIALPSEKCQTCEIYDWCGGGCPLKWAVYNPYKIITGYNGKTLTTQVEGGR